MMPPKNLLPPCDTLPPQRELHDALYRGQLFSAPANDTSLGLVERVRHRLEQTFADISFSI